MGKYKALHGLSDLPSKWSELNSLASFGIFSSGFNSTHEKKGHFKQGWTEPLNCSLPVRPYEPLPYFNKVGLSIKGIGQ